ncbi:MAG TPA: hypothetical protein VGD80_23995 [Kofleriaceae bacterium]
MPIVARRPWALIIVVLVIDVALAGVGAWMLSEGLSDKPAGKATTPASAASGPASPAGAAPAAPSAPAATGGAPAASPAKTGSGSGARDVQPSPPPPR